MHVSVGYAPGLSDGRPTTLVSQSALSKEHDVAFGFPRRSAGSLPFMDTSIGRLSLVSTPDGLYELPFVAMTTLALASVSPEVNPSPYSASVGAGALVSPVPGVTPPPSPKPVGAASRSDSSSAYSLTHLRLGRLHHRGISDLLSTTITGLPVSSTPSELDSWISVKTVVFTRLSPHHVANLLTTTATVLLATSALTS
eukprot:scaffold150121_cov19-Prasinocladus_malaysianus.AAC.1